MSTTITYRCDHCSEPATVRVRVDALYQSTDQPLGVMSPPLALRGGVDLCPVHLEQLHVQDGSLVIVDPGSVQVPKAADIPALEGWRWVMIPDGFLIASPDEAEHLQAVHS